jgi:hypothetical protein
MLRPHRLDGYGRCAFRALANTFCPESLKRECRDETRVSFSHYRCLPTASIGWCRFRRGTTRHLRRGKLRRGRARVQWPHDARPSGCVARSSVQRTGPCRHRVRWRSGRGLCRVHGNTVSHACSKRECRVPVRRCLLAGHDPRHDPPAAVARPCPAHRRLQ